jgi:hypothetical protein
VRRFNSLPIDTPSANFPKAAYAAAHPHQCDTFAVAIYENALRQPLRELRDSACAQGPLAQPPTALAADTLGEEQPSAPQSALLQQRTCVSDFAVALRYVGSVTLSNLIEPLRATS